MKTPVLLASLLLLMLLLPPAGHSAHHRHHYPLASSRSERGSRLRLLPLRVLRTPAVAGQHRLVRAVARKQLAYPNE